MNNNNIGLVRIAAATTKIKIANVNYNAVQIIDCIKAAEKRKAGIILFPELCLTGYTCGDLFFQDFLYTKNLEGLSEILTATKRMHISIILGTYFKISDAYFNCGVLIQQGEIKGITPKFVISDANTTNQGRWFSSNFDALNTLSTINILGKDVPFGSLLFSDEFNDLSFGIELSDNFNIPISMGSKLALMGAQIIFNPSASYDYAGKGAFRKSQACAKSAQNICGYVYASSGISESTTDYLFDGHKIIAENGTIISESKRFQRQSNILYGEIDFLNIKNQRIQTQFLGSEMINNCYYNNIAQTTQPLNKAIINRVCINKVLLINTESDELTRIYHKNAYISQNPNEALEQYSEIFNIQVAALAKRIVHSHSNNSILGISGGLDSTLALLVCTQTHKILEKPMSNIIAITMPGFGTSDKTYENALTIMRLLGVKGMEISIKESVLKHFEDIGQSPSIKNTTYENSQARERTQILMDIANKDDGLVIGTGDLSEIALGWCTYNGDHMSMYGVNSGIPKTIIRDLVLWIIDNILSGPYEDKNFSTDNKLLAITLKDILNTPISPELLPPDESGNITQFTEGKVGPYILHDFFLYHTVKNGFSPQKLYYIAKSTFGEDYKEEQIKEWLMLFYRRFFTQQFKRSCSPDGPRVFDISLSPRGGFQMPSDADLEMWLKEIDNLI